MIMMNQTGLIVLVNAQIQKMFGYSRSELLGQPMELLVPERFREQHPGHRKGVFAVPSQREMGIDRELYGLRKNGSEFPLEIELNPIEMADGVMMMVSIIDITERKQAEEQFRLVVESARITLNPIDTSSGSRTLGIVVDIGERKHLKRQSRLSEFSVNHSSVSIFWVTLGGRVFRVNKAACNMMGYTEEELLQMTVPEFIPAIPTDRWTDHWQELKEKKSMTYESSLRHKVGHMVPVEVRSHFLEIEGQEYNVKFMVDITDRKRKEEYSAQQNTELDRSNSELEQFAYVVSHDLQEPLRMVSSYCGLLARRYKGKLDKDADEFIDFAVDGATRMKRMIDDLLHYSRVGRKGKPFTPINSADSVRAAVANLGLAIKEAHAVITCDPLPMVFADSGQLTQVFQNLIGNALKFRSERDARIQVSARCSTGRDDPSQWEFSVQDNGIGIEQRFDERVFVIFQRLHARERYPGNGMGLAIAKKIIERHGGRIWLESKPAEGTTFFFTLRGLLSQCVPVELPMTGYPDDNVMFTGYGLNV